jgi:glyoxylate reductase
MSAPDVLIPRAFPPQAVEPYEATLSIVQGLPDVDMSRAELLDRVRNVRALVSYGAVRVDEELLDTGVRLEIVANWGVGYDSVNVTSATRRGVWVTNTPGVVTEATADVALMLLLATLRRAAEGFELVRHGTWSEASPETMGTDPAALTLGILGLGRIGQALARRVAVLGMRVIYHSRTRLSADVEEELGAQWVPFDELLATSDVLSVHMPLTSETRGRIGRAELSRMRPGAFIINAARGPIIDEGALMEALLSGHVAGVGLDVYSSEPDVPAALREHPRAFCLPHIGTATTGTRMAMMRLCLDNIVAVLGGGRPLTPVNALDHSRLT